MNNPDSRSTSITHRRLRELLPWFVNETLSDTERQRVARHLHDCEVCRGDVEILAAAKRAVVAGGVEPIVPPADPDALLSGAARGSPETRRRGLPAPAMAAAAIAAVAIIVFALSADRISTAPDNRQFETATSAEAATEAGYMLRVEFSDAVPDAVRDATIATIEDVGGWSVDESRAYVVRLEIAEATLATLEGIESEVAALPGVESASFVAIQIPVR